MNKLKVKYNSPVILSFAIICLVVIFIGYLTDGVVTNALFVSRRGGIFNPLTYVRHITYVFGHANFEHFFGNITFILLLGPLIEEKYGSKKLILMMIITAFTTGIFNSVVGNYGLVGASGIVFMLIILSSVSNTKSGEIPLTLVVIFIMYIGKEVYNGLALDDSVSQMAHIIGGIAGAVFGFVFLRN